MSPLESIAGYIPPHVRRGHLVGVVREGEVLDLKRCWTSIGAHREASHMGTMFATDEVVRTTVPEVLDFCANASIEAYS